MIDRIGNCRIVEEVASGGMAVVYRAIHDTLGRTVAIKALKTAAALEEHIATRFEREAKSLANLQHENIISVYDFHREHGALFIVMEYVSGIDLYDLLERSGRLPFDLAAIVALQVARALDYIHYRGIVHRDIKPANIMLARQGGVKLMDFGIARDKSFEDLTEAGTGIGTPAYMSPEQILGDKLDARSDLFSLGIVLYQMLTGGKPFIEDEQRSVMHKIRLERHPRVRKLNPDIPRELERIVDKCLEKQPRDRWQSAQQVVMALERFLAKYVEVNYHARLVMFLKAQGLITQLEADEYVSPLVGVPGQGAAGQPNLAARVTSRRGAMVQGVILGVLLLMLGLIHVAPLGEAAPAAPPPVLHGYVHVNAYPWGEVAIDQVAVGATPLARAVELTVGPHTVTVTHPWFQPITKTLDVAAGTADQPLEVRVDFERDGALAPGKTIPKEAP
ncbi:MAG: serine/threonine protein kinase [Myxococcales bacterium]|nr:serine/threonine protein kinase [Myxococcales bacterium]MBK7191081.1 serine/threonine protein kinase [Myxococcales bacterium]